LVRNRTSTGPRRVLRSGRFVRYRRVQVGERRVTTMIATVHVADIGRRSLIPAVRKRPAPGDVPGLRWLDVAPAAALASNKPPGLRRGGLSGMWDDEASAPAFADSHLFAQRFADNGFQAVLRPLRAFGSWPGLPADVPRNRVTHHDAPVIVTT